MYAIVHIIKLLKEILLKGLRKHYGSVSIKLIYLVQHLPKHPGYFNQIYLKACQNYIDSINKPVSKEAQQTGWGR